MTTNGGDTTGPCDLTNAIVLLRIDRGSQGYCHESPAGLDADRHCRGAGSAHHQRRWHSRRVASGHNRTHGTLSALERRSRVFCLAAEDTRLEGPPLTPGPSPQMGEGGDRNMTRIHIYDTTLRDGSQGEGVNFS